MNPIEENAANILIYLTENKIEDANGDQIKDITGLKPDDINAAIEYLESIGGVDVLRSLGTDPYEFFSVMVNSRGISLYHELKNEMELDEGKKLLPERPFNPVGSPYGFTEDDWDFVKLRRRDRTLLNVVFGLQYESKFYDTEQLEEKISDHFQKTIEVYNAKHSESKVTLQFEKLTAGYGEHLFNSIARSIIGSDIAVFEVSDGNQNVMIELGVALTWGIRVLPLREKKSSKPPTDISGQTWIEYENSGENIFDKKFHNKLELIIETAIAKKGKR
ncbi:MAG: hypothetical protein Q8M95_13060 [Candidatus Methanoperedens sp.]|nr:hypothetical protein [Candidatus Methanoperedens sp.]